MAKNILIIAAECEEIDELADYLRKRGLPTDVVSEETEAIEVFQNGQDHIVVADSDLPGLVIPGFVEALLRIRSDTKIIIITRTEMPSVLNRAVQSGVACYARKPFDRERLFLQMQKF